MEEGDFNFHELGNSLINASDEFGDASKIDLATGVVVTAGGLGTGQSEVIVQSLRSDIEFDRGLKENDQIDFSKFYKTLTKKLLIIKFDEE